MLLPNVCRSALFFFEDLNPRVAFKDLYPKALDRKGFPGPASEGSKEEETRRRLIHEAASVTLRLVNAKTLTATARAGDGGGGVLLADVRVELGPRS